VAGLPDFFIQHTKNGRKYTKLPQNIPNWCKIDLMAICKIYQHLSLQGPPKFSLIGFMGLKLCRLATLISGY
jgi:hypothetical protein